MSKLDAEEKELLKEVFNMFDLDESGSINTDDLPFILQAVGLGPDIISYGEVLAMQNSMDPQSTGQISFESFKRVTKYSLLHEGSDEEKWRAFRLFDVDSKGFVSRDDILRVANLECGGLLSEEQCQFIFDELTQEPLTAARSVSNDSFGGPNKMRRGIAFDVWKAAVRGKRLGLSKVTAPSSRRRGESVVRR